MSKLAALVAIPLGLLALKRLQKEFPDDPTAKPIGFTLGPAANGDFTAFFPETLPSTIGAVEGPTSGITAPGPTVPLGGGQVWTPIFPDTASTFTPTGVGLPSSDFTGFQEFEFTPFTPGEGIFDLSQPIEFKPFTLTGIE
jgi:hypothetical protein